MRIRAFRGAAALAVPLLMLAVPLSAPPAIQGIWPLTPVMASASAPDGSPERRAARRRQVRCAMPETDRLRAPLAGSRMALLELESRARTTLPLLLERTDLPARVALALSPPLGADQIADGIALLRHAPGPMLAGLRDRGGAPRRDDRSTAADLLPSVSLLLAQWDLSEADRSHETFTVGPQLTQVFYQLMCSRIYFDGPAGLAAGHDRGRAARRATGAGLEARGRRLKRGLETGAERLHHAPGRESRPAENVGPTERQRISGVPLRAV